MRRSLGYRVLIAIWGLWFTAALSGPAGLHSCAVHSAHASPAEAMAHGAHVSHHGGADPAEHQAPRSTDDCSCLALCCCAAAIAARWDASALPTGIVVTAGTAMYPDVARPNIRRPHFLPFANGPPATRVV